MKQLTELQEKYAKVYMQWINESDPVRKLQLELQLKSVWNEQRKQEKEQYPSLFKSKQERKQASKQASKQATQALMQERKRKELERTDIYDVINDLI